jgi:hypothetical protein
MDAGAVAAVAALVALVLAFVQWRATRVQARSAEIDLLREMRSDWLELKPQWHRAILTAIGPDNYYSPADIETRKAFRELVTLMGSEPSDEDAQDAWHRETRDQSHEFEQAERDVLTFLATLASVVFRGRLSPDLAYTVVGLDVVRRSRQIRVLLGAESAKWTLESQVPEEDPEGSDQSAWEAEESDEEAECPWVYWVDSVPGLTDRIFGLLDVLWAEAARRFDMETHDLVGAALLKRHSGSGLRNRLRVRRIAREHGGRLAAWKLEWGMLAAEFLRVGPPRRIDMLELELIPLPVQGWGFRGWARRRWTFVSGRFKRSRRLTKIALPR